MLRQFKNVISSVQTYGELSPDLQSRRQVDRALYRRRYLSLDEWFQFFWQSRGIAKPVVAFAYIHLEKYSGLQIGRVLPSDRLEQDLKFTLICWFDWHLDLCEDFWNAFGVEIFDRFDLQTISTVEEFVTCLNYLLSTADSNVKKDDDRQGM